MPSFEAGGNSLVPEGSEPTLLHAGAQVSARLAVEKWPPDLLLPSGSPAPEPLIFSYNFTRNWPERRSGLLKQMS